MCVRACVERDNWVVKYYGLHVRYVQFGRSAVQNHPMPHRKVNEGGTLFTVGECTWPRIKLRILVADKEPDNKSQ